MNRSTLSEHIRERLRCPVCRGKVETASGYLVCGSSECGMQFPVVDGVPVLLNEKESVFNIADFAAGRDTTFPLQPGLFERMAQRLHGSLPAIGKSVGAERNYARFGDLLLKDARAPRVLVVGGSILGEGMQRFVANPTFELVATDVSFGPLTSIISDAHDIPFDDQTFEGVVVQAVLEHVVDPYRCVQEIHRVLKSGGLVYAETPFMQQVHLGPYDFTRFTHSGHRRLFRSFEEIASGPVCGPGMALAWSYQYFLLSFTSYRPLRGLLRGFASVTSFYLKYFDTYLVAKRAAYDGASGFYFMGRKARQTLSDRELIRYYKGAIAT